MNGLLFVSFTFASESRIMTYNLLNFTGDDNAREDDLQTIIAAIDPDIIVAQEIDGNDGYEHVLSDVLDPIDSGLYEGAPFTDQNNTNIDNSMFCVNIIFIIKNKIKWNKKSHQDNPNKIIVL